MPQQQNLFSSDPHSGLSGEAGRPAPRITAAASREAKREPQPAGPWLYRSELLVRIIVRLYLGLLLMCLPWLHFWTENTLLSYTSALDVVTMSGFARGAVSGLGLLNVGIAIFEAFERRGN